MHPVHQRAWGSSEKPGGVMLDGVWKGSTGVDDAMTITRTCVAVLAAGLLCTTASACTGTSRSGSDAPGVSLPAPASAAPAAGQRQSIASASAKDIAATFRSNGVDDPEHWAKVVTDHEPYPSQDPSLAKLRTVLGQERADPALTQKILDILSP